jgi:hypothetical protein
VIPKLDQRDDHAADARATMTCDMTTMETMNVVPTGRTSLVVAAGDGPGG